MTNTGRFFSGWRLTAVLALAAASMTLDVRSASGQAAERDARPVVGSYASQPPGSVNTHWIETSQGLIVVDAQRVTSEARRAVEAIRATGKPVLAVLVTHPHPDHFGGLGTFVEAFGPNLPIYASARTIKTIKADAGGFIRLTERNYGADFEERVTLPNRTVADGEELAIGGVRVRAHEFGAGEAPTATVFHVPGAGFLFPGDIVSQARTPFVLEARSAAWLAQLVRLRDAFSGVRTIYPGHGDAGGIETVAAQADYLTTLRGRVSSRLAGRPAPRPIPERAGPIRAEGPTGVSGGSPAASDLSCRKSAL